MSQALLPLHAFDTWVERESTKCNFDLKKYHCGVIIVRQRAILFYLFALVGISLSINACSAAKKIPEITEADEPNSVFENPLPTDSSFDSEMALSDDEATELMYTLTFGPNPQEAVETILATEDIRFIAVLIELMRANQIGMLVGADYGTQINALETLSGQSFGDDWPAWVEWYGSTSLTPPPGFTGWKGRLLGNIDPGFAEFLQDDLPSAIRVEEII